MKGWTLLTLRLSLALLMLVWGLDKIVNPGHGVRVAEAFYGGILAAETVMSILGGAQILLAVLIAAGLFRHVTYPILALLTGVTMVGVWRSIVDPWGWYLEGSNPLFFPSLIIFAGALVLIAFRDQDAMALDGKIRPGEPTPAGHGIA